MVIEVLEESEVGRRRATPKWVVNARGGVARA